MRRWLKRFLILTVIGGIGYGAYVPVSAFLKQRRQVTYREEPVARGGIVEVVNSTGTIEPVRKVLVGAIVSGPILKVHADFNDEVETDDLLAEIDPRLYEATYDRDMASLERDLAAVRSAKATLNSQRADVDRIQALLDQAARDYRRAQQLRDKDPRFISQAEMDQYKYSAESLKQQKKVAEAAVLQAEASVEQAQAAVSQSRGNLKNSKTNLEYTKIYPPVPGIIIDRKVDDGASLASAFQAPELFIIAPRMREEMYVYASVDEADIGLIRRAQAKGQPVQFTVDAYPDDLFEGTIKEIRRNATTTQNVVTYPVVVSTTNPDLKLFPGMTANLSFQIAKVDGVLKIPNGALRFYPEREQVHPNDRPILDGAERVIDPDEEQSTQSAVPSASERAAARKNSKRRHVWVQQGQFLRAIEVWTGLSDSKFTELAEGELSEGQKLVTGIES